MEKLIELINKYKEEKNIFNTDMDGQLEIGKYIYVNYPCAERLCSKKYGFIERLVKNDYININKVERDAISYFRDESPVYGDKIWTTRLIMMLSVSNSPIKDLIYYLGKEDKDYYIKPGGYKLVFNAKK